MQSWSIDFRGWINLTRVSYSSCERAQYVSSPFFFTVVHHLATMILCGESERVEPSTKVSGVTRALAMRIHVRANDDISYFIPQLLRLLYTIEAYDAPLCYSLNQKNKYDCSIYSCTHIYQHERRMYNNSTVDRRIGARTTHPIE